ncbi:MAG: flagellar hook assembly protein FlgD [Methylococcaceae bacterium]|jgi:flagellar basal-body rod modification protein FlgD
MNVNANTVSSALNTLSSSNSSSSTTSAKKSLGIDDFLKLFTTQLTHQDPTKPADGTQFLTQIAQIGTVSGIQDLQKSFSDFATSISSDQALQASGIVGRYVSVPSDQAVLPAGGEVRGQFDLTAAASNATVKITNQQTGESIRTINLGSQSIGTVPFVWDGLDNDGTPVNPGVYKVEAEASIGGKNTAQETQIFSKVDSVTLGTANQGLQVNLQGLGAVDFNKVKEIL